MANKRKHQHHSSGHRRDAHRRDQYTSSGNDHKRRRLSNEMSSSANDAATVINGAHSNQQEDGDDGWTKVSSKSSKRDKKKEKTSDRGDYPALRNHQNYQSEIRLKDVRDLGLYVLADEVAPKWTAVANSKSVRKVVVVMLPGLDEKLLRKAEKAEADKRRTDKPDGDSTSATSEQADTGDHVDQLKTDVARHLISQAEASVSDDPQAWLFGNVLQVKAPGDSKMSRVHSPLQAMLLCQESDQKQSRNSNNNFTADRTPITEFIHNADELREAEFPIHPALFTADLDAELEAVRRSKSGQSTDNGWFDTTASKSQPEVSPNPVDPISKDLSIYSLDCEMVQTSDDATSLARISLIKYPAGTVIIDKYVKPKLPITNYFTQYSGITPQKLENVTTSLEDIQKELLEILTPSSVLLGHSLDSDLNALKLTHPFVIDTSIIYPHPRGLPLRSSLKYLTNKYLKREIQTGGANGHNSVEDAQAVLDLVKLKCEKGPKWGTIEANGEPIFRRLKRNGRTSAMVDYGTPERGFGKDATHTVGCQNDDEIVKGVVRAVQGDDYFDFEIPAGGVDYVWGRLRALEYARGWVSDAGQQQKDTPASGTDADEEAKLDAVTTETIARIQQIYDALPAKALLVLFSGTGDVRPVMRLQAQQQQYRKEFKVKKWDDLSIKWTDTEEQALKRACEDARRGWAVCAIK